MNNEERIAKLAKIWVEWNNPVEGKINGDNAMHQIGNLFKKECLLAWNVFIKVEGKRKELALRIKHEMVREK